MRTVVFSDVHLDASEAGRPRQAEFVAFLRGLAHDGPWRLIILGDLFDFWFEYRHAVFAGYFHVLRALADLHERGIELHLVCGNHDFWAGPFLEENLGFVIHREPTTMDFDGRSVLLVHGDGLNPRDWGYRLYKRFARARPVIRLFRLLHPDRAMGLARLVSRTSRRMTLADDPRMGAEAAALRVFARDALGQGQADVVLCGHAHAPAYEQMPTPSGAGLYINTGDWMLHRTYIEWDGREFRRLGNWPEANQGEGE